MPKKEIADDTFVRISELAEEAGVHPHTIERLMFRGIIEADSHVRHGKSRAPIFLESRMPMLLAIIRDHQND